MITSARRLSVVLFAAAVFCVAPGRAAEPAALPALRPLKPGPTKSAGELAAFLDKQVQARLEERKVPVSPLADDAEFLRRASLDLTGVVPTAERVAAFLDDKTPDKRTKLIDELLARPEYARHLTDLWRELLFPNTAASLRKEHDYGIRWLEESFAANKPWSKFVTELLSATGFQDENGAVTFMITHQSVDELTDRVARVFLGVNLQCAQCHDHPFHDWTRQEYWGLAGFFREVRPYSQRVNSVDRAGVNETGTGKPLMLPASAKDVSPRFLRGEEAKVEAKTPALPVLARWITGPDNPYFARATANRLWQQLFGRGLVEPLEDLRADNPATHPELLDELARQLLAHDYDLKYLYRALATSQTYQRTSRTAAGNETDVQLYSHMTIKVLTPYALADSTQAVLGLGDPPTNKEPAVINDPQQALKERKRLRGPRDSFAGFFQAEEGASPTSYQAGLPQALRLMNGRDMPRVNRVANEMKKRFKQPEEIVDYLFRASLSRRPTEAELKTMLDHIKQQKDLTPAIGDVVWALLNSTEFLANH